MGDAIKSAALEADFAIGNNRALENSARAGARARDLPVRGEACMLRTCCAHRADVSGLRNPVGRIPDMSVSTHSSSVG